MSTLKEYLREVRDATTEHLEARHRDDTTTSATQQLPREEALATIALVTLRLLEQQLAQTHGATSAEAQADLLTHVKACRRALKPHAFSAAGAGAKRSRSDATATSASTTPQDDASSEVELGQYADSDAFGSNNEKRLKFARLMGGAKAAAGHGVSGSHAAPHSAHNTHAKNSAEVRRMNESLESQFESAMSHKGKKGLGA